MSTDTERLLHDLSAPVAQLRGITGVHSDHTMTSSFSLISEDIEECAPTGIHDALCKGTVLHHVENLQLLYRNRMILLCVLLGRLVMEVTTLPFDLEMGLRRAARCFAVSFRAFLATGYHALFASQGFLRGAIEARVLNGMPLAIGQEGLETHINADSRMLALGESHTR